MASTSLQIVRPTLPIGILKATTNTVLAKTLVPSIPFTNKRITSNARAITKLTCVSGATENVACNNFNGAMNTEFAPLRIGIIGFGNFGQFIAKGITRQGHSVLAVSRTDYSEYCKQNGIQFFRNVEALCEKQPDVILVCSSILSTESIMRSMPIHKLKPDTIFSDVLSVKEFPRNLFLNILPTKFGIICTHPMFGPESGKNGWNGLPFVFEKVRITDSGAQAENCAQFLKIFEQEGCRMVEMSCEEHDIHAAGTQFITHTIGRILDQLNLETTPINTKGYETLLQLTENTVSDSFDLYYGLFMYNANATEQMDNLDRAFEMLKQKLYGRLHAILRKQIVQRAPMQGASGHFDNTNPYSYQMQRTSRNLHL